MMTLKTLLSNWKTTSAGLTLLIGATVHLVFSIIHGTADESVWRDALVADVTGIGLILAGDASKSAASHQQTVAALVAMSSSIKTAADAAAKGDTETLHKVASCPLVDGLAKVADPPKPQ